jgi:hypothetical protein
MNEETIKKIYDYLLYLKLTKDTIRTRGNVLPSKLDNLTNPMLNLEREEAARTTIAVIKVILNTRTHLEREKARSILINKE